MGSCNSLPPEPDGDMVGVGEYKNLNPFVAKKQSALFRQRIDEILSSVKVQCLGTGGIFLKDGGNSGSSETIVPSGIRNTNRTRSGSGSSGSGGLVEVVKSGEDDFGAPLEILENDLRDVSSVLRVFSTNVRDEIVGACLLARPKAYHAYGYDYSKSAVLTLRCGAKVCTAAVVTLRVIDSTTRCLEVSWVATLRDFRKRGFASYLFGYIQQIAAIMGIEAVIVLSSRTSVGYWLTQPRAPSAPRVIMVRHKHSEKRLTKGYSKMDPRKLQKLEAGLRRSEVFEEPPESVAKFYSKDSPFRFDHARSIHVWYVLGLAHVDYLSLARSGSMHQPMIKGSVGRGRNKGSNKSSKGSKGSKGGVDSSSSTFASKELQSKFLKSAASAQARQAAAGSGGNRPNSSGSKPKRSRSLPSSSGTHGSTDPPKRSSSFNQVQKGSPYKVRSVASAKLIANKLKMKSKSRRSFRNSIEAKVKKKPAVPQTS